jgi:hypothetical protein
MYNIRIRVHINIRYLETRSEKVYSEHKKYIVGVITRL